MQAYTGHFSYGVHEMDFVANELLNDSYAYKALEALNII
jgi:hypothetical protein